MNKNYLSERDATSVFTGLLFAKGLEVRARDVGDILFSPLRGGGVSMDRELRFASRIFGRLLFGIMFALA